MADRVSRIVVVHRLYPLERVSVYLDYCRQKRLSRIEEEILMEISGSGS